MVPANMSERPKKANCVVSCVIVFLTNCLLRLLPDFSVCFLYYRSKPLGGKQVVLASERNHGWLESLMQSCKTLMIFWLKNNTSPVIWSAEITGIYELIYLFTFCLNKNLTMELKFNRQKPKLRAAL